MKKSKTIKRLVFLVLAVAFVCACAAGCGGSGYAGTIPEYDVVVEGTIYSDPAGTSFTAVCKTFGGLKRKLLLNGYDDVFNDDGYFGKDSEAALKVKDYLNDNSKTKALVAIVVHKGSGIGNNRIDSMEVENGKLVVCVRDPFSDIEGDVAVSLVVNSSVTIVGVDKSYVNDIKEAVLTTA